MDNFDYLPDYEEDEEIKRLRQIIENGPTGPTIEKEGAESVVSDTAFNTNVVDTPKPKKVKKNCNRVVDKSDSGTPKLSSEKELFIDKDKKFEVRLSWSSELHYKLKVMAFLRHRSVQDCVREAISEKIELFFSNPENRKNIDIELLNYLRNL